jgi:hypothetical protein
MLIEETTNLACQFQVIFVVSLPERTDRRDSMQLAMALGDIELSLLMLLRGKQPLTEPYLLEWAGKWEIVSLALGEGTWMQFMSKSPST